MEFQVFLNGPIPYFPTLQQQVSHFELIPSILYTESGSFFLTVLYRLCSAGFFLQVASLGMEDLPKSENLLIEPYGTLHWQPKVNMHPIFETTLARLKSLPVFTTEIRNCSFFTQEMRRVLIEGRNQIVGMLQAGLKISEVSRRFGARRQTVRKTYENSVKEAQ